MDLDRNLIPFTNPGAMWINHFSRFGPFWPFRELSGIQAVGCIIGTKNHILTGGLLRWRVLVDGEEQTPGFPRRDYYPWVVVETTLFGPVSVSAHTYFVGPDQIKTNFIVSGQAAADIRIEFESPWDPVRPIPGLPRHPWPPEVYRIDTEPVGELNVAKSGGRTEVSTDFEVFFFYGPPDYPGFKGLQKGDRSEAHWIAETEPWTFRSESEFS
jgi:hypothetical protein